MKSHIHFVSRVRKPTPTKHRPLPRQPEYFKKPIDRLLPNWLVDYCWPDGRWWL